MKDAQKENTVTPTSSDIFELAPSMTATRHWTMDEARRADEERREAMLAKQARVVDMAVMSGWKRLWSLLWEKQ